MFWVRTLFLSATATYLYFFSINLGTVWFNPLHTNDDAQQQLFPLWKVIDPALFPGDIITRVMEGYLPPLHYALSYVLMHLTEDPVMTGHWVGFIQITLTIALLFAAVRAVSSTPAACVTVFWFLLSQPLWTRIAGGLPRGWAPPVIAAFLYALLTRRHNLCVAIIFIGVFLNPPAAFLIAAVYSLWLCYLLIGKSTRTSAFRPILIFTVATPIIAISALQVTKSPSYIGSMVTYDVASKMDAFRRPGGRFAFIPFRSPIDEIGVIGTRSLILNRHVVGNLSPVERLLVPLTLLLLFSLAGIRLKRMVIPRELWAYLVGILLVYFLSRALAFRLYVPDRHLLIPLNLAWITLIPIAVWRIWAYAPDEKTEVAGEYEKDKNSTLNSDTLAQRYRVGGFALVVTILIIVGVNGIGLRSAPGLHQRTDLYAGLYRWIRTETPIDSIIASQPARIDLLPLAAQRIAYVTAEVAHPFYPIYYKEMSRRILISLSSYYTRSWKRFIRKMRKEKIDYYIFFKHDFTQEGLERVRFFRPFGRKLRKWTRYKPTKYLPFRLHEIEPDQAKRDFVVYEDDEAILIDINRLLARVDSGKKSHQ